MGAYKYTFMSHTVSYAVTQENVNIDFDSYEDLLKFIKTGNCFRQIMSQYGIKVFCFKEDLTFNIWFITDMLL